MCDRILNVADIGLGDGREAAAEWSNLTVRLADALDADSAGHGIAQASVAFKWSNGALNTTLSLAGAIGPLTALLRDAATIVRPHAEPSTWIEAFNDALHKHAPRQSQSGDWLAGAPFSSRLSIPRRDTVNVRFVLPASLIPDLPGSGALSHTLAGETRDED